mmetsp:Transcript_45568/g.110429  ORF Transcript_45568/g.110429 Transcript_45568/m.110429 type:complete len:163 (-) Transcript_45568:135-623(-)|eukprot:CAMPEP_0113620406 /NCGR_PEP_ID=MMETSP0017_2-20120614/10397_1 /TAXON_ID=2856 /ORGANISM="Cylindrotheca closterium" /LENGTH=162 /DNA_ID=CAMNT_0000530067 /DNA_START=394 /DNA_END=882 /DNA_ORIENTATION=+ /assembly_acc=CAM_ASM_000147
MARRTSSRKASRGNSGAGSRTSNEGLDGSSERMSQSHRPRQRTRKKGTARTSSSTTTATASTVANTTNSGESSAISMTSTTTTSSTTTPKNGAATGDMDAATSSSNAAAGGVSHGQSGSDNDITNHPPDCNCYLRRLNKSLFLPPSLMMEDDQWERDARAKR